MRLFWEETTAMLRFLQIWILFLSFMTLMATCPGQLQAADIAPLVDQGWLLGGYFQGKWLSAQDTAKALKGGETYQLYTVTRSLGRARGSKPLPSPAEGVMPEFGVTFKPPPPRREPVVAVGATWNARPRQPRLLRHNLQPYEEAAKDILKSKGIADPQVNLTRSSRLTWMVTASRRCWSALAGSPWQISAIT